MGFNPGLSPGSLGWLLPCSSQELPLWVARGVWRGAGAKREPCHPAVPHHEVWGSFGAILTQLAAGANVPSLQNVFGGGGWEQGLANRTRFERLAFSPKL